MLVAANSRKLGARCLAGVSLLSGRLVRPISRHGHGALSEEECGVGAGTPRLFDVVSFAHEDRERDPAQPENVVIAQTPWKLEGALDPDEALDVLLPVVHRGPRLFLNRGRAVPEHVAAKGLQSSLALIEPEQLRFGHGMQAEEAHPGSARALFRFGGKRWSLPVTDFDVAPKILKLPEGVYGWSELELGEPKRTLLTVSLGTAHEGWHHKLVAAVLHFP
jgi:hypothetical protein